MKQTNDEKAYELNAPKIFANKIEELNTVRDKVAWLIRRNHHLADCDKCLLKAYEIQVDGYDGQLDSKIIHALTPSESVRRCRQKLQELARKVQNQPNNLNWLLPSDVVDEARQICEGAVRTWCKEEE